MGDYKSNFLHRLANHPKLKITGFLYSIILNPLLKNGGRFLIGPLLVEKLAHGPAGLCLLRAFGSRRGIEEEGIEAVKR